MHFIIIFFSATIIGVPVITYFLSFGDIQLTMLNFERALFFDFGLLLMLTGSVIIGIGFKEKHITKKLGGLLLGVLTLIGGACLNRMMVIL